MFLSGSFIHNIDKNVAVFIIGKTGAGKSTLAQGISEQLGWPLLSYSDIGASCIV